MSKKVKHAILLGFMKSESKDKIRQDSNGQHDVITFDGYPFRCIPQKLMTEEQLDQVLGRITGKHRSDKSEAFVQFDNPQNSDYPRHYYFDIHPHKDRFLFTKGYMPIYAGSQCIGYAAVRSPLFFLIFLILTLVLCGVLLITMPSNTTPTLRDILDNSSVSQSVSTDPIPTGDDSITEGAASTISYEDALKKLQQLTDESKVKISINTGLSYQNGKYNVLVTNSEENRHRMYVQILRDEDGKELWTSPAIDPGYSCNDAKFTVELPAGQTDAHAMFWLYSVNSDGVEELTGKTAVKITITT